MMRMRQEWCRYLVVLYSSKNSYSLNASMEPVFIIVLGVMHFQCSILS